VHAGLITTNRDEVQSAHGKTNRPATLIRTSRRLAFAVSLDWFPILPPRRPTDRLCNLHPPDSLPAAAEYLWASLPTWCPGRRCSGYNSPDEAPAASRGHLLLVPASREAHGRSLGTCRRRHRGGFAVPPHLEFSSVSPSAPILRVFVFSSGYAHAWVIPFLISFGAGPGGRPRVPLTLPSGSWEWATQQGGQGRGRPGHDE
jgi:hypothetical protein